MKNFLDESERECLYRQHKREHDGRIRDRIKAVLLYDKGWSYERIAEALFITHEAIRQHTLDYEAIRKLKPQNGGSSEKLNRAQRDMLIESLEENTYFSAKEIVSYVWEEFEIKYSIPGMINWLKAHGFCYKKPCIVPGKADRETQKKWIEESIFFMDGVHPTHNTKASYGWIKKGEQKEILSNTGRQRINISGAVDIVSKKIFVREDETLDAESTIDFLKFLEESNPNKKKIHLFCDNARYYRNKKVQTYLETSRISMIFLPPYSPNLNPIERLWKFMNEQIINNRYYKEFKSFKKQVMKFLLGLVDPPEGILKSLTSRITDNFRVCGQAKS